MRKRRYEILLPLKHNDGRPVADEILYQTRQELVAQFGALSFLLERFEQIEIYITSFPVDIL